MPTPERPTGLTPIPGAHLPHTGARSAGAVLDELSARLLELGAVGPGFASAVRDREARYPTGLPTAIGTAIPHTDPEHARTSGLAVATLDEPVDFGLMGTSGGTVAVRLVVMLVLDDRTVHEQPLLLQHLIGRLQGAEAVTAVLSARDEDALGGRVSSWLAGGA